MRKERAMSWKQQEAVRVWMCGPSTERVFTEPEIGPLQLFRNLC